MLLAGCCGLENYNLAGLDLAQVAITTRSFGDARQFVRDNRARLPELVWLNQIHGGLVVDGTRMKTPPVDGDGIVAKEPLMVAVFVADCLPVALLDGLGNFGVFHCGWRGLASSILANGVCEMRRNGAKTLKGVLGPCIGPCCYEFSPEDLGIVAKAIQVDPSILEAKTNWGTLSFDLRRAATAELSRLGVEIVIDDSRCTGCHERLFYSARIRNESQRMAMIVGRSLLGESIN